jgi:hypothetical protein
VTQLISNPFPNAGPRTRGSVRRASGFVQIAESLIEESISTDMSASRQPGIRAILLENRELVAKREDLRLQGGTGSKTGGNQSEKGNEKRANRDRTRISRMIGTSAFSARTEFSVTTPFLGTDPKA